MANNVPSHFVKMWTPLNGDIDERYNFLPFMIVILNIKALSKKTLLYSFTELLFHNI